MCFQFAQKIPMSCLQCIFIDTSKEWNDLVLHNQEHASTMWTLTDQHTNPTAEGDQEDHEGKTSKHNYLNQQGDAVQHYGWKAEGRTREIFLSFFSQTAGVEGQTDLLYLACLCTAYCSWWRWCCQSCLTLRSGTSQRCLTPQAAAVWISPGAGPLYRRCLGCVAAFCLGTTGTWGGNLWLPDSRA